MDRARHRTFPGGKVIEQAEKERQVGKRDAPLVHGEDEAFAASGGLDQPVGVRNAFGNALGRNQFADIVLGDQGREVFRREMGIDCHDAQSSTSWRGSLKIIFSTVSTWVRSSTARHWPSVSITSRTSSSGAEAPGGEAERLDPVEPCRIDLAAALDQLRGRAAALGDLDQPQRIRAVGRADHQHQVAFGRDRLDRRLAVGGRVADVLGLGSDDLRKAAPAARRRFRRCRRPTGSSG